MPQLIHQWTVGDGAYQRTYRVIKTNKSDANWAEYVLDRQAKDALGEPTWVREEDIKENNNTATKAMCILIEGMLAAVLQDPALATAYRLNGLDAVSDMLRERFKPR